MGALVRRWEFEIARGKLKQLYFNTADGKQACFVDPAVFTRNRVFRVPGATKLLQNRMLLALNGSRILSPLEWQRALVQDHTRLMPEPALVVAEINGEVAKSSSKFYDDPALGRSSSSSSAPAQNRKRGARLLSSSSGSLDHSAGLAPKRSRTESSGDTIATLFCSWVASRHKRCAVELRAATSEVLVVNTDSRDCPFRGGKHKRNTIYYVFKLLPKDFSMRLAIELRCRDPECPKPETLVEPPPGLVRQFQRAVELMDALEAARDAGAEIADVYFASSYKH